MINWLDIITAARTVYGEAEGESQVGKIAVAHVLKNRFESKKWFGGDCGEKMSLKGVCQMDYQFSCWNLGEPRRAIINNLDMDNTVFQKCIHAVLSVFRMKEPDPTDGATHYYASSIDPPKWALHTFNGEEHLRPYINIGNHRFFRDID